MNPRDPVKIVARAIADDDAAYDAEQEVEMWQAMTREDRDAVIDACDSSYEGIPSLRLISPNVAMLVEFTAFGMHEIILSQPDPEENHD